MPKQVYFNLPQEKKDHIRSVVIRLFGTMPYEEVTTRILVSEMGISMGSLYKYFESKDEMYLYFLRDYLDWRYESEVAKLELGIDIKNISLGSKEEESFLLSLYQAPVPVLMQLYFDHLNGNAKALHYFSILRERGMIPKDVDLKLYLHVLNGVYFSTVLYAREHGIAPDAFDPWVKANRITLIKFGYLLPEDN